ncbi:MAG: hypothetical protein NTW32_20070 [Chloroflexi bacterium]|nr:hypothetical protein [Chloroflexota bacterium]
MLTRFLLWIVVISLALTSCAPAASQTAIPAQPTQASQTAIPAQPTQAAPTVPTQPAPAAETQAPPALPTQGVETQMPTSAPNAPAGLEKMVETARLDLAERISVPVSAISLLQAGPVNWSNAGLGCPDPGMVYAEVITPGYQVILRSGDKQYEYHAGKDQLPIFCKNPQPPSQYDPSSI